MPFDSLGPSVTEGGEHEPPAHSHRSVLTALDQLLGRHRRRSIAASRRLEGVLVLWDRLRHRSDRRFESRLDEALEAGRGLSEATTPLETLASRARILSLNARIEASMERNDQRGFESVAREMTELSRQMAERVEAVVDQYESLEQVLNELRGAAVRGVSEYDEVAEALRVLSLDLRHPQDEAEELREDAGVREAIDSMMRTQFFRTAGIPEPGQARSPLPSKADEGSVELF